MKVLRCEVWLLCLVLHFSVFVSQELDESEGGDFLFFSINEVAEADVSHLTKRAKTTPDCEESVLLSYMTSLQVINPESLIALGLKNKLDKKCHNITKTIDHMGEYMKSCNVQPEQELYVKLYNGVKALHKKLCTNDPYHKIFMEHRKCYGQLLTEVGETCNGPADWCDSSDAKRVCRAYQEIKDCYYIKASILCGDQAAKVFKELVQCIIESIITVNCTVKAEQEPSLKVSKEQQLLLKGQKLSQTADEEDITGSSQPLRAFQLFTVLSIAYLVKLMEFVIQYQDGEEIYS